MAGVKSWETCLVNELENRELPAPHSINMKDNARKLDNDRKHIEIKMPDIYTVKIKADHLHKKARKT